ncbi:MAG: monooxygenase [Alphaproteobacteria bacterium]|nr:MAG: monooxygenase [Alphaproteobacteria bacterium]
MTEGLKRGRHQSLYFDYPVFPFTPPAEMRGERSHHKVAVVGGGPVGMVVALELARRGIASVVIEAADTLAEGSRAICFSRRSLEILEGVGVADAVIKKALPWTRGTSYYRNRPVYHLEMPHSGDDKYYPMVNLQQCWLEQFILDRVAAEPLIEMRWQSRVSDVRPAGDHVVLRVDTPDGEYSTTTDWLVAADGARSAVRRALGLKLNGTSYEGRYVIADILIKHDYPTERRVWFDPPSNPGSTVIMHRQPDDIWRIDYQLLDDADEAEELQERRIRERIQAQLEMIGETADWKLDWFSLYKAHALCLDNYVHGRVIFAGDAAHLVPIFGVRGLNSGLADANNLGWKLAWLVNGWAAPELLGSYNDERRAATLDVFENAIKSTKFMTPPSRGYDLMRDAVLSLSLTETFARPLINPRQSVPYTYQDGPLTSPDDPAFAAGPIPGDLPVNLHLGGGRYLLDHLGAGFTLISFGPPGGQVRERIARLPEPGTVVVVGEDVADPAGRIAAVYGARQGTAYLVRPDGHIAARWHAGVSVEALEAALARLKIGNAEVGHA